MISISSLSKSYETGLKVLDNVNLEIKEGDFLFIVGDSGTGKSTLLKILSTEMLPTDGYIGILGHDTTRSSTGGLNRIRRKLGVVYQDLRLIRSSNVFENVALSLRINGIFGKELKTRVDEALESVGLSHKRGASLRNLSGGEKQRIAVARALARKPAILIADEPTGSLDSQMRWTVMEAFQRINSKGTAIIVATHEREIVRKMGKKQLVLKNGKLIPGDRVCIF